MHLMIVTDIFGRTSYLEELVATFSHLFNSIDYIDPYAGVEIDFQTEQEAYAYFMKKIGLPGYFSKLEERLKENGHDTLSLLGFSIGASAIWAVSETTEVCITGKVIAFYSSQIRDYLHIKPQVEMELFFAKTEPRYSVDEVITLLSRNENVSCCKTDYEHGFMNRKSANFHEDAYRQYVLLMKSRFEQIASPKIS